MVIEMENQPEANRQRMSSAMEKNIRKYLASSITYWNYEETETTCNITYNIMVQNEYCV